MDGAPAPRPTAMGRPASPERVRSRARAWLCAAADTGRVRVEQRGMHVVKGLRTTAASRACHHCGGCGVEWRASVREGAGLLVRLGKGTRAPGHRGPSMPIAGTRNQWAGARVSDPASLGTRLLRPFETGPGLWKCVRGRGASPSRLYVAQLGSEMRSVSVETGCGYLGVCLPRDWLGLEDAEKRRDQSTPLTRFVLKSRNAVHGFNSLRTRDKNTVPCVLPETNTCISSSFSADRNLHVSKPETASFYVLT